MTDALIHLRVPAALKSRWIRDSRSAGMRLTDWVIKTMNECQLLRFTIPDKVGFADLKLRRDPDGAVSFDWSPIERICEASGIDVAMLRDTPEDNLATLIVHWYGEHLTHGGARDPVQDELIAETVAEDARGGGISYAPGRA